MHVDLLICCCAFKIYVLWIDRHSHKATDLSKCVPLIFHGDDGESHRRRSFMVTSFASALIHKSPWDCRYVLYCVDNSHACSSTFDILDSWLAWSFVELAEGKWFGHSPWGEEMGIRKSTAGTLIADGWRGILFAFRGDEKALAKLFHVKTSWVSHDICFHCKASRISQHPCLYTSFGKNAPHRATLLDLTDFVTVKCDSNPWVRVPGFHPSMIIYDWLHVLDLALVPDAAASAARLQVPICLWASVQFLFLIVHVINALQALIELCEEDRVWPGKSWCADVCCVFCSPSKPNRIYRLHSGSTFGSSICWIFSIVQTAQNQFFGLYSTYITKNERP